MTAGRFYVRVEKRADAPTLIHWHGLLSPYGQEGVPNLPQAVAVRRAELRLRLPDHHPGHALAVDAGNAGTWGFIAATSATWRLE